MSGVPRVSKQGLPAVYRSSRETVGALWERVETERWVVLGPAEGGGLAGIIFAKNAPHENLRWEFCFTPGRLGGDLGTVMLYWKYLQWDQASSREKKKKICKMQ